MNEETFTDFLSGLFRQSPDVVCGPGDDAAVLESGIPGQYLLAAADQVVQGIHYTPETPPGTVAEKLLKRNLSDIAAMGGVPRFALVTLSANPLDSGWMRDFHLGLESAARRYDVSVIGGDIASQPSPGLTASLTILGTVSADRLCLRSLAEEGDLLYCTGELGNSFRSGHHLNFTPRLREASVLAGRFTHAMMDISDGLLKDAARMAAASGLSLVFDGASALPLRAGADVRSALSEGEDYELIFAVAPASAGELEEVCNAEYIKISRIGVFRKGRQGDVSFADGGAELDLLDFSDKEGFDHFHGDKRQSQEE